MLHKTEVENMSPYQLSHNSNELRVFSERHTERQPIFQTQNDDYATTETDSDEYNCPVMQEVLPEGGEKKMLHM